MLIRGLRKALGLEHEPISGGTSPEPGDDVFAELRSPKTQMAIALGAVKRPDQVYGGTVAHVEVQRRRSKNRQASASRRINRRRSK